MASAPSIFQVLSGSSSSSDPYDQIKAKFPVTGKEDCYGIQALITGVSNETQAVMQNNTLDISSATRRANTNRIDRYTTYLNEVRSVYATKNCDKQIADADQQQFFDTQYQQLQQVKQLTTTGNSTAKYLVIGMIGLLGIATVFILIKKKKG